MAFPWCVCLVPEVPGKAKGALLSDAAWPVGRIITVSFLDGPAGLQDQVMAVAQQWLDRSGADLTFELRRDTRETDIRISFELAGSWSKLGRYAEHNKDPSQPTMNFGWLGAYSSDLEVQEVVLHEFGHALGLLHEHQHPEAQIPWDRDKVLEELKGPPNFWNAATIERNIFEGHDPGELRLTPFDEKSIMLYPVNPEWTTTGYGTVNNTELSELDVQLIRDVYGV